MNTDQEKVSYIIGRQIGTDFRRQGIEISLDDFAKGVSSAFHAEDSEIDRAEMERVMNTFQQEMQEKAQDMAQQIGEANRIAGESYLEKNKTQEGVQITDSGLQYRVIETGAGKSPELTSTVEVHYEGTLIDGTIFDSSYQRGQSISFPVNGVIPGWTEALQLMKEGDVWELVIPSDLAYGAQGAGQAIGPHSTLKFKVELITVK